MEEIESNEKFEEIEEEEVSFEELAEEEIEAVDVFEDEFAIEDLAEALEEAETTFITEAVGAEEEGGEGETGFENIVAVGIGEKEIADRPTGELSVKVYVVEKEPLSQVTEAARVPDEIQGVKTDVEEVGVLEALKFTGKYPRPVPCGVSIGNIRSCSAGTLGCLVYRGKQLYILSNNHVMALSNAGKKGDLIVQPGRFDTKCKTNKKDMVGILSDFKSIAFEGCKKPVNEIDAALAKTDLKRVRPNMICQKIRPSKLTVPAKLNMLVKKCGRTTQFTRGIIKGIRVTSCVNYGGGKTAAFKNQILIRGIGKAFSDRGDSGSLVMAEGGGITNRPVGLLFAGNASKNTTIVNPISSVLRNFRVRIY